MVPAALAFTAVVFSKKKGARIFAVLAFSLVAITLKVPPLVTLFYLPMPKVFLDHKTDDFRDKTAKRFRPPAQGCRLGYPGIMNENDYPTAKRLCHLVESRKKPAQPRCGWVQNHFLPRVAEAGNPGLEDATALRLRINLESHRSRRWFEVQPR